MTNSTIAQMNYEKAFEAYTAAAATWLESLAFQDHLLKKENSCARRLDDAHVQLVNAIQWARGLDHQDDLIDNRRKLLVERRTLLSERLAHAQRVKNSELNSALKLEHQQIEEDLRSSNLFRSISDEKLLIRRFEHLRRAENEKKAAEEALAFISRTLEIHKTSVASALKAKMLAWEELLRTKYDMVQAMKKKSSAV